MVSVGVSDHGESAVTAHYWTTCDALCDCEENTMKEPNSHMRLTERLRAAAIWIENDYREVAKDMRAAADRLEDLESADVHDFEARGFNNEESEREIAAELEQYDE